MNTQPLATSSPRTRCRAFFGLLGFLASAALSLAQMKVGSVDGKVTNAGTPLPGAIVTIPELLLEVPSESDGTFYFGIVPIGSYTVNVSYLGLPAKDFNITVAEGQRAVLDAKMGAGSVGTDSDVIELSAFSITGQRAGQARALNQQRASNNLRSLVSADTLGRFPDQNAAESMQRITGVSLARDQGEGRFISVRGVDPDLNNTQINGINVPASQEDSRAVNLDVFPTDALDSIEVVKAITADMDADAIGGSVNMKTLTAFSSDHRILRVSAETQYNNFIKDWGYKGALTWGDQFKDGRIGLLVSLSQAHRYFGSVGYETDDDPWVLDPGANGTSYYTPGSDIQHREYVIDRLRRGINVSLDFKPTLDDNFFIRGVYSHFSDYENRFRTRFRGSPGDAVPTSNTTGTVTDRPVVIDLKDRSEDNDVTSYSAGGSHKRGAWNVDYVVAFAKAELIDPFRWQPEFESPDTSWDYDFKDRQKPAITGPALALTARDFAFSGWALDKGMNKEEEFTAAINLRRQMSFAGHSGHLKFGGKYRAKSRTVDITSDEIAPSDSNTLTLDQLARTSSRGVTPTYPSINPKAFRRYYLENPDQFELDEEASAVNAAIEDYETDENILAGYVMADVTFGKLTLTTGIRVEHTEYENRGWSVTDEDPDTLTGRAASREYDNFLPSAVVRYDFTKNLIGRVSWTNTLARPKFLDASVSRSTEDDDVTQGNPNLKPYKANNWDASLEFYPQKGLGVMSVGVFRKDIKNFIFSQVIPGGGVDGGSLITPLNGPSASVTGIEADWQQQFSMLPSPFDGLGLYANLTLTDSESELGGDRQGEKVPFLSQSKRLSNVALSYEKYGFFIRLSATHRSRYLSVIGEDLEGDQYVNGHLQFDLSGNYKLTSHITIYAEVLNLTNEPHDEVFNVSNALRKAEFYSWSANAGVKLSF